MKREIPILLTVVCGLLMTWAFFAPNQVDGEAHISNAFNVELNQWALVFFSLAFLLGISNLVRINLKQITARHPDSPYETAFFHDSNLPSAVRPSSLPSRRHVFEFELQPSEKADGLQALQIELISTG